MLGAYDCERDSLGIASCIRAEGIGSFQIQRHLLAVCGDNDDGQPSLGATLSKTCSSYRLRYQKCNEAGARAAIHARRPLVATFALDHHRWAQVSAFYKSRPKGTLTARDMSARAGGKVIDHAVVLIRCDNASFTFMNSWGPKVANNGFFTVDKASTPKIMGGPRTQLYDVYSTPDDLFTEEIAK